MNVLFKEYTEEDYKKTGYKDGIYDGKREAALNMLKRNYSTNDVIEITGLSNETIK